MGPQQERDVLGAFEVGLARDPRTAVARPEVVHRRELVEAEHPLPTLRQPVRGGAAHAAEAEHDHVVVRHVTLPGTRVPKYSISTRVPGTLYSTGSQA